MSQRPPPPAEEIAAVRADSTFRALAERDSLEPSRALDRAVLARARAAAQAPAGAGARRGLRSGLALRLGLSAGAVAAAIYAVIVLWTASHPAAPRVADQRLFEVMHAAPIGPGASQRGPTAPELIETSVHPRSIRVPPPKPKPIFIENIDSSGPVQFILQPSAAQGSSRRSSSSSAHTSASVPGPPSR